jgi:hypothetical protein
MTTRSGSSDYRHAGQRLQLRELPEPEASTNCWRQGVTVPGCDAGGTARRIYQEIQQIIHDHAPYVFISGGVGDTGYNNRWAGNVDPGPWSVLLERAAPGTTGRWQP